MFDVFISYRRNGSGGWGRSLYDHFCMRGINAFYDVEELSSGKFNEKLYRYIEDAPNFLLLLSPGALGRAEKEDDWLRLEILHALQNKKNVIPVTLPGFSWEDGVPAGLEELRNYNGVALDDTLFAASFEKILSMMTGVKATNGKKTRVADTYLASTDIAYYTHRVDELFALFDTPCYERLLSGLPKIYALDLGSNTGDKIVSVLGDRENLGCICGADFNPEMVQTANEKFANEEKKIGFSLIDVEKPEFPAELDGLLAEQDIPGFNFVHISMLLFHLKNPFKVLKTVRDHMTKDGVILIKDLDDGYTRAYPDEDLFSRAIAIRSKCPMAGNRETGRQIYSAMKRAGFRDIRWENAPLSTVGADVDLRGQIFDTVFPGIRNDLRRARDDDPDNRELEEEEKWLDDNYDGLEEKFRDGEFFFSLGLMMFTAKK